VQTDVVTTVPTASEVEHALLTGAPLPPASFADAQGPGMYAWLDERGELLRLWPAGFPSVDPSAPIYIGKATVSLAERGVLMHLAKTRVSALRRSLASLLVDELDLLPGARAHLKLKFSLGKDAEERLTDWMHEHLTVVTVAHPAPDAVECAVIGSVLPPLNGTCAHHGSYWRPMGESRAEMHRRIMLA
jgi:hypothetical protein